MQSTPRSNRLHISFFGQTNSGKSSLINALTGQNIALVSDIKGTTTDPVYKAMELLPIGPVVLIDTAGINDTTPLGHLRQEKTMDVLSKTDIALLVFDSTEPIHQEDIHLINTLKKQNIPCIALLNKIDAIETSSLNLLLQDYDQHFAIPIVPVSAKNKQGIDAIKKQLIQLSPKDPHTTPIVSDLLHEGDTVVLVTPIDSAAPKGRIILPQQQTLRDILDHKGIAIVTQETECAQAIKNLHQKPALVITDSQAFGYVASHIDADIPLTSFSILFARHKGDLNPLIQGATTINHLNDGDKILIAEGCTHHRQTDDIGTVKIPKWLKEATGKNLIFEHTSGVSFTSSITDYRLVVHCGGCMLNSKAMNHRIHTAAEAHVPIVNYGILIAYIHGILHRALKPFPEALHIWDTCK